jgi:hypothetical protein
MTLISFLTLANLEIALNCVTEFCEETVKIITGPNHHDSLARILKDIKRRQIFSYHEE